MIRNTTTHPLRVIQKAKSHNNTPRNNQRSNIRTTSNVAKAKARPQLSAPIQRIPRSNIVGGGSIPKSKSAVPPPIAANVGKVKIPKINNNAVDISWENAGVTSDKFERKLTSLKKWFKESLPKMDCKKNPAGKYDCNIDVSNNNIGSDSVGSLVDTVSSANISIRTLKATNTKLDDQVVDSLCSLVRNNDRSAPVKEINVANNRLSAISIKRLAQAIHMSKKYPVFMQGRKTPIILNFMNNVSDKLKEAIESCRRSGMKICDNFQMGSPPKCRCQPVCSMILLSSLSSRVDTPISKARSNVSAKGTGKGAGLGRSGSSGSLPRNMVTIPKTGRSSGGATTKSAPPSLGKGKGKGGKLSKKGREGIPDDPWVHKTGKEVHNLLKHFALEEILVKSWKPNWEKGSEYQRIEWFGDKILGHLLTELSWDRVQNTSEGFLTNFHQQATCNITLSYIFELCNIMKIMETVNNRNVPELQPFRGYGNDKNTIKRKGDAIEVIFGDISQQIQNKPDNAQKLSQCIQLLAEMCLRCSEWFFWMEPAKSKAKPKSVPKGMGIMNGLVATPKSAGAGLGSMVSSKAAAKVMSKAGASKKPGMTMSVSAHPDSVSDGPTLRPVLGARMEIPCFRTNYTRTAFPGDIFGFLHLSDPQLVISKYQSWGPVMDFDCDLVIGRRELSILALTPFALETGWTMRADRVDNRVIVQARSTLDTSSKTAKSTILQVAQVDISQNREFPTTGMVVTIGDVKFFVVLDGCEFRNDDGVETDLGVGPEDQKTLRSWWTKTLFVPQVIGVITEGSEEDLQFGAQEVRKVEIFPQDELAPSLDKKVSFGFIENVLKALKGIMGSKKGAAAIMEFTNEASEVKVFEIPGKKKSLSVSPGVFGKAPTEQGEPTSASDAGSAAGSAAQDEEDDDDEALEFDGGMELQDHNSFAQKLLAFTTDLEFDGADEEDDLSEGNSTGAGKSEDEDIDIEFDDDESNVGSRSEHVDDIEIDGEDENQDEVEFVGESAGTDAAGGSDELFMDDDGAELELDGTGDCEITGDVEEDGDGEELFLTDAASGADTEELEIDIDMDEESEPPIKKARRSVSPQPQLPKANPAAPKVRHPQPVKKTETEVIEIGDDEDDLDLDIDGDEPAQIKKSEKKAPKLAPGEQGDMELDSDSDSAVE